MSHRDLTTSPIRSVGTSWLVGLLHSAKNQQDKTNSYRHLNNVTVLNFSKHKFPGNCSLPRRENIIANRYRLFHNNLLFMVQETKTESMFLRNYDHYQTLQRQISECSNFYSYCGIIFIINRRNNVLFQYYLFYEKCTVLHHRLHLQPSTAH